MNMFAHGIKQLLEIAFYSAPSISNGNHPFTLAVHGGLTPDSTFSLGRTVTLWALALLTSVVGRLGAS